MGHGSLGVQRQLSSRVRGAKFQTILPKNYIHRVAAGEAIYDFFAAWKRAAAETRSMKASLLMLPPIC